MAAGPESWSDVDLIRAIARSDRQGLAGAWHRYSSEVHWVAIAHTKRTQVREVAQIVGLDVFEVTRSLRAILTKIARADDHRQPSATAPPFSSRAET